jgi:glycosyltransferase involved in cell wall biosynthesis
LLTQKPIDGDFEILVIDGGSTDRTLDIVRSFPEYGTKIRLLHNPRRLQVYAWNMALREMRGSHFAMMTAHADYAPDYFVRCFERLRDTGAAAVGGVPWAQGEGRFGVAVAFCMSSPFGVGSARFRYLTREEACDTVPLIFARKETIQAVGGWDERIAFDEDSDMSYRLRANGGRLIVSPAIGVKYYVRQSAKGLWKQMFRYGYWRRFTQLKHPGSVPVRIMAPTLLLAGLAASALLASTPARPLAAIVPAMYAAFLFAGTTVAARRIGRDAAVVPFAMAIMHAAYGMGYLNALVRMRSLRGRTLARSVAH